VCIGWKMNCFEIFRNFSSVAADKYHSMVLSTQILPNYQTHSILLPYSSLRKLKWILDKWIKIHNCHLIYLINSPMITKDSVKHTRKRCSRVQISIIYFSKNSTLIFFSISVFYVLFARSFNLKFFKVLDLPIRWKSIWNL